MSHYEFNRCMKKMGLNFVPEDQFTPEKLEKGVRRERENGLSPLSIPPPSFQTTCRSGFSPMVRGKSINESFSSSTSSSLASNQRVGSTFNRGRGSVSNRGRGCVKLTESKAKVDDPTSSQSSTRNDISINSNQKKPESLLEKDRDTAVIVKNAAVEPVDNNRYLRVYVHSAEDLRKVPFS